MASSPEAVKIVEVTKISPSPTIETCFSLPLSFFDIMWFESPPVDMVYFYQIPDLKSNLFNSLLIPKLKNSLSQALLHYFPVAANLTWPSLDGAKPIIRYASGDGVSFTVAESTNAADFNRLSGDGPHEAIGLHHLAPQLTSSDDASALLAIQITLFPNQGFSIGTIVHHAIFDARSFTNFINSWAYLSKSQGNSQDNTSPPSLPSKLTPIFDRSIIKDPINLDTLYLDQWLQFSKSSKSLKISQNFKILPRDLVRATFRLTRDEIKKLRQIVASKWHHDSTPHLSTFVLTLAYVTACKVKARGGEKQRNVICSVLVDYRKRLDPSAPENYFGNCIGACELQPAKAGDFMNEENGLAFAVKLISDGIKGIKTFEMDREVQEKYINHFFNFSKRISEAQAIFVSASPQLEYYGTDFGWGRPKKVEMVSINRSGAISLIGRGDGSGEIEIGVALEKQEMESFASFFNTGLKKWCHRCSCSAL